ncbi:YxiG family protein [Lysinibacillus sp. NPDC093712]|uniref:YxiG family protein n=1 Tax=Lysinibacillus sp. NPDC093712 TaxID=3390579 RepID=UPI003D025033
MRREKIIKQIENLLFTEAEFGRVFDIKIDYMKKAVKLVVVSLGEEQIEKTMILFEQVLSLYMCQFDEAEGIRLNELGYADDVLLSEIGYHPNGFGKIKLEKIDLKSNIIKENVADTNFYFQLNDKDYFFLEANRLVINDREFNNLLKFKKDT